MFPAAFDYQAPSTLEDALGILAERGDDAKVMAGGQSLIPMLALRLARPSALVDINGCSDLDGLAESGGTLMRDVFSFQSPLGILGRIADFVFLKRYMRNFLIERNRVIKGTAESDAWRKFC